MIVVPSRAGTDVHELAAPFVAGRLSGAELERFEEHLLACPSCQQEVALGLEIRAAGSSVRGAPRRWAIPALVAAAAALALFIIPPTSDRTAIANLGQVEAAPVYLGIAVRGDEENARFDAAMRAYQRGDHAAALRDLRTAPALETPPALFFRGASELMLRRDQEAAATFTQLLALGDSPYHEEARFYRAKALLRRGEATAALRDLRAISDPGLMSRALALADSVEAAIPR